MHKSWLDDLPEVFISTPDLSKKISEAVARGKLRKLGTRLYTKNMTQAPETLLRQNWYFLIKDYYPDALIADRTALENQPTRDGSVFLISERRRETVLPGITFKPRQGNPALNSDREFAGGARLCSTARAFLENMRPSRVRDSKVSRTLSVPEIEEHLDRIIRQGGPNSLNRLRDDARAISGQLGMAKEFKALDTIIGGLLGTREMTPQSPLGQARLSGAPYDPQRLKLFDELYVELSRTAPVSRLSRLNNSLSETNFSFFEAYFSNFIEGTEFEVDEAYQIVFEGRVPKDRPADAHDVLGTYKLVSDINEMCKTPRTVEEFFDLLRLRHAMILSARSDKNPGMFKDRINRVGNTIFVEPDLVTGTLEKGFQLYRTIDPPLHRAIFMMFMVSEVHPFNDGNGRVARIMMNAELAAAEEQRILIPIVFRNNYLSSLRALSQTGRTQALIRTLDFAQKYAAAIDWSDFGESRLTLQKTLAFMNPNEADDQGLNLKLPKETL